MFNWKKAIGFGVLIWIIMFVTASIFVAYGVQSGTVMSLVILLVTLLAAYFCARNLVPTRCGQALGYGLVFAVIGIVLDFVISSRFVGGMFSSMWYWVSYALVVLTPCIAVKK